MSVTLTLTLTLTATVTLRCMGVLISSVRLAPFGLELFDQVTTQVMPGTNEGKTWIAKPNNDVSW